MATRGWRLALAGASGAVGREIAAVLAERRCPVAELRAFGSERSSGEILDWFDEEIPVEAEVPPLRGLDLLIVATPGAPALELVRDALRAEVPVIDCSGSLASSPEVPLVHAALGLPAGIESAPALCQPAGPVLAWAPPLAAIDAAAGVRALSATWLRSASGVGRAGPGRLSDETVAVLTHREAEDADVFPGPIAFDCVPLDPGAAGGPAILRDLGRLLGRTLVGAVHAVQVPVFVADGGVLWLETGRVVSEDDLRAALEKAPGLDLRDGEAWGPSTRDASGSDRALVSVLGASDGRTGLWVAGDGVRLAAVNAVHLAEARLGSVARA